MIPLNEAERHLPAAEDEHPPGEKLPWGLIFVTCCLVAWTLVAIVVQIAWVRMW